MSTTSRNGPSIPSPEEAQLARECQRPLASHVGQNLKFKIADSGEKVELPASAVKLLLDLLGELADGQAVTVFPLETELTTQQAADLLNVSRPFLIKQLETGMLPYRMVGTHRRVALGELIEYKREVDAKRSRALDELAEQAQELDLGY